MKKFWSDVSVGILIEFGFWTLIILILSLIIYIMFRVIP
jgi:hypothetical protein